ncbi:unnamed protein product, partial [Sphenostylis stenocarpa]
ITDVIWYKPRRNHWITLNEPWSYSRGGYAIGIYAPGRCSEWLNLNCTGGDSGTEPYLASHYQLLAHAASVQVYKKKYQKSQKGIIGITLVCFWYTPYSNHKVDKDAANRALDFMYGWFMEPLTSGKYPESMISLVGERLPKFSEEEARLVTGSYDFIGLNYYTTAYAANAPKTRPNYDSDSNVKTSYSRNGIPIGQSIEDWYGHYGEFSNGLESALNEDQLGDGQHCFKGRIA